MGIHSKNFPMLRWDFLLITDRCCVCQHLGAKSMKNIQQMLRFLRPNAPDRSVYTMFFKGFAEFCAQILAFAICFSWILLVGAVQANTEISNVWKTYCKSNNLKFKKRDYQLLHYVFHRFCSPDRGARVRPDTIGIGANANGKWRVPGC